MRHIANRRIRSFEVHWTENDGGEPHQKRRHMELYRVGVFIGTFCEQWQEANANVRVVLEGDDRPIKGHEWGPHKHGGDNLGGPNPHGDTKTVVTGGVYYDAWMWTDVIGDYLPGRSLVDLDYTMAEPGRGIHLGLKVIGYRLPPDFEPPEVY